jgi:hypothetical protein
MVIVSPPAPPVRATVEIPAVQTLLTVAVVLPETVSAPLAGVTVKTSPTPRTTAISPAFTTKLPAAEPEAIVRSISGDVRSIV